jgi:protoporphyrinogen oxidase
MDPVLIIGAGMAGLACAARLHRSGCPFVLIEASERVGGRVKTDRTADGFLLDHGFQVLLSSYTEVRRQLDIKALSPSAFRSGAVIRIDDGRDVFLRDPLRDWRALPSALAAPIGSLGDKLRLGRLIAEALWKSSIMTAGTPMGTTLEYLRRLGFTQGCLDTFFSPFFGGVFLDRSLSVDERFFRFVFRQFVFGRAMLPKEGMEALPNQMASLLPKNAIRLATPVAEVTKKSVLLENGTRLSGAAIVIATDSAGASKLLPGMPAVSKWRQTTCLYFAAHGKPGRGDGYIRLNARKGGFIHNVCFPSDVAPSYAPVGHTLVSVSVHGELGCSDSVLLERVLSELVEWFGSQALDWRHLRTYVLPFALPAGSVGPARTLTHNGVFVCGDHAAYPSLNAAMETGRLTAEEILATKC